MVTLQNQEETDFLRELLPVNKKYYWIGVMKKDGMWIWDQTGEEVPEDIQKWAPNEPDNSAGQDCVEIYIRSDNNTGKWNDENCLRKKGTVCYKGKILVSFDLYSLDLFYYELSPVCMQCLVNRIPAVSIQTVWKL